MTHSDPVDAAIQELNQMNRQGSDGIWLQDMTVAIGKEIKDWDFSDCTSWHNWKERTKHFPEVGNQDIGIDVVGIRRDGKMVAIQCKSRKLDPTGKGSQIRKEEIDSFVAAASNPLWKERWLVTNGDNPLAPNAIKAQSMSPAKVKMINIGRDLEREREAREQVRNSNVSKTAMQDEAVEHCVKTLRNHSNSDSGGWPVGQARGRLILPCGVGKTRISLRIVQELTEYGELSLVLCPSIALVAQIRCEYLQFREKEIETLAVCSDESAGITPNQEGKSYDLDPTIDTSFVSASEVKGKVTTDPAEIAEWMRKGKNKPWINVIFGTYQSAHKIAEAFKHLAGESAQVLIADEAHRTAGIKKAASSNVNERIRNFTVCHDNDEIPAKYRVYQTATPRIYSTERLARQRNPNWIVRTMDDETVFGVELYRRSYVDAVENDWLCNYRIIAFGINDQDAFDQANKLSSMARAKDVDSLKTAHYLRGLAFALAMAGATRSPENTENHNEIGSCIGFMNTIEKSKTMVKSLQTQEVSNWIQKWFRSNKFEHSPSSFALRHLDASSNSSERQEALKRLGNGNGLSPQGILNVGIFGEGTDSPSLNAVAFLEPRRSPIDVIQAVGRAMRTAHGKKVGYIICPILIPPHVDPEIWLSTSVLEEGWKELGQILLALRAHDQRIETELEHLIDFYLPTDSGGVTRSFVAIAIEDGIKYYEHEGKLGTAEEAIQRVLAGKSTPRCEKLTFLPNRLNREWKTPEPTQIFTGKRLGGDAEAIEMRTDTVQRDTTENDSGRGKVDIRRCREHARNMINRSNIGRRVSNQERSRQPPETSGYRLLRLSDAKDNLKAIKLNLLERSGLKRSRVERDLNILENSVNEAARHLREDELEPVLQQHFKLGSLKKGNDRADGCTVASLLLMNAALLHQRIHESEWVQGIAGLSTSKNATNVIRGIQREWEKILRHDYRPVFEPALDILDAIEDKTARRAGLERALHHIAGEAERIADTYADMGMDHAGPLFNRVMGDQQSDGAFFTRPLCAAIAASLALDACGNVDWKDEFTWKTHKIVDLACGSGTLLAAILSDMRRRAREAGANTHQVNNLHRVAVEHALKGLDINPVSLQLAAAQLTIGNTEIRFSNMGLHLMPYGPHEDKSGVAVGTLELLAQQEVLRVHEELIADVEIESEAVQLDSRLTADMESSKDAVKNARIVIMNPPFTNRTKMGEKFADKETQHKLRYRVNGLEERLVKADPGMTGFWDKNSIGPLFVALADHCLQNDGILCMVIPTAALCAPSGLNERLLLAKRYHIHTILTCHLPGQIHMSQGTNINESILVARRQSGTKPNTRFVHLDRFPMDDKEAHELSVLLRGRRAAGGLDDGWGEVSYWPSQLMAKGDWSPAVWRSPILAAAAEHFSNHKDLLPLCDIPDVAVHATGQVLRGGFKPSEQSVQRSFPIIKSKGGEGQTTIKSRPDEYWVSRETPDSSAAPNIERSRTAKTLEKAGHLLVTAGQRLSTARLTAVADQEKYVGNGWMPVTGLSKTEAEAIAVFLNSTVGRLQLMRTRGKTLPFPTYSAHDCGLLRVPDVRTELRLRDALVHCYHKTQDEAVPPFRDGEDPVRAKWDNAVEQAMGWQVGRLSSLRNLLHKEPFVRDLGYHQFSETHDEI